MIKFLLLVVLAVVTGENEDQCCGPGVSQPCVSKPGFSWALINRVQLGPHKDPNFQKKDPTFEKNRNLIQPTKNNLDPGPNPS